MVSFISSYSLYACARVYIGVCPHVNSCVQTYGVFLVILSSKIFHSPPLLIHINQSHDLLNDLTLEENIINEWIFLIYLLKRSPCCSSDLKELLNTEYIFCSWKTFLELVFSKQMTNFLRGFQTQSLIIQNKNKLC